MLDIGFIKELYLPGLLTAVSQCLHHWNDKSGKYLSPFKESQPFFPYGPWKREDPIQHRPFDANASRTFPASPHDPPLLEFLLGIAIGGGVYKSGATVKLAAGR